MRVVRLGPEATAADIRALTPAPRDVEAEVRAIIDEVRGGGDAAVKRLTARFDHAEVAPASLLVPLHEIEAAVSTLEPAVLRGLKTAIANVRAVANAGMRAQPARVELPERHVVEIAEVPVRRAAAYVPGGRAPYPSTVVMCATVAHTAGVDELAVCAPPGPEGRAHPTILAACALCDVTEVYRVGGAQAIAALAYGTETIPPVDVIVGPGNAYVTEAKRQVNGVVGIDGLAGPSELVVVATPGAEHTLLALDLLAQAEHGDSSLVVAISPDPQLLDLIADDVAALAAERPTVADAPFAAVLTESARAAMRLADEIAPEHLELAGTEAEGLAGEVRSAGCLFVGRDAATAFGDYVAGSNHVLPTGGAARHASGLSPATFRRRMARVSLPPGAAARLAPHGAAVARAEGFEVHGESMERRA
ncbi:MAG: histidinol dehydrogenase [Thermoleophilaceae bacterium]|nr:histidinol dehydrogenase [Thermoleophilaceae bacterium]